MKKIIALLLAAVMVLAFAACGAQSGGSGDQPLSIIVSISNQETETAGQLMKFYADKVAELSGGSMVLNVSYGGTLFSDDDIMAALKDGSVQLTTLSHVRQVAYLPVLTSIPDYAPTSSQNAIDYFNELMFKNPTTSAIINAEAEKNNIKYLAGQAGGANALVAQYEFTGLQDFIDKSTAFGNMEAVKWSALGLNVVSVFPWDYYQAFETGQMDSTQMASTPMISMSIQELAKYWMYDNTYTAGQFVTVNLDFWNSLTADQQKVLQDAATALEAESIRVYDEALASEKQTLADAGVTLVEMSQADFDNIYWPNIIESKKDDAMTAAQQNGNVEDVQTILQAAADFTGYSITF